MTSLKVPPYLSEVKPEEQAFILLKRTRASWARLMVLAATHPLLYS